MSWHMLGTQYEHAGAPDDGPCPSCEVVRLRTEVAALEAARLKSHREANEWCEKTLAAGRDLAALRRLLKRYRSHRRRSARAKLEKRAQWKELRRDLAALREERDRLRDGARKGWDANMALSRDLATARNSQKHDWRAREYWRERATAAEADNERARALLARARDQLELCKDIPIDALGNKSSVTRKVYEDARAFLDRRRAAVGVPPFTPTADSSATSPVYAARDEARRCTCVPHSGDCELRHDEAPRRVCALEKQFGKCRGCPECSTWHDGAPHVCDPTTGCPATGCGRDEAGVLP